MRDLRQGELVRSQSIQQVTLRWTDFDQQGHIYHAKYLELLDEARTVWLQSVLGEEAAQSTVVVHVSIDYLAEVTYEHMFGEDADRRSSMIDTRILVEEIGTKSLTTREQVLLPGGKVSASVKVTFLFWDRDHRRSRAISQEERGLLLELMDEVSEITSA